MKFLMYGSMSEVQGEQVLVRECYIQELKSGDLDIYDAERAEQGETLPSP